MFDDQNTSSFSTPTQAATTHPHQEVNWAQHADPRSQGTPAPSWGIHHDGTKAQTYCDYYWMMSPADYLAWLQKDDGSEPPISFSKA